MASFTMRCTKVSSIESGVIEVLKSDGVRSMISSQAEKAASRCNAMMQPQLAHAGGRYEASTKDMHYLVGGVVSCGGADGGKFARIDNYRQNTLKKGCGI